MLLTRSLPPQFLLPAWSAAQLAHAVQRAHKSGNNTEFKLIRKTKTKDRPGTYSMMKFKRLPFLKERVRGQVQGQMQEQTEDEQSEEALSLYDELFPEERRHAKERRRKAEERLDKLPAFKWNMDPKPRRPVEKDREKKSNESNRFRAIAQSAVPALEQAQAHLWGRARGREASVLILRAVSKTLEESDFFRIGPKGEHIEGWTSGLTKVIQGRDRTTLEPLGHYFIIFSSDAAARAYLDQTVRLHTLSRAKGAMEDSYFPPPVGYLNEGENITNVLRGFSLVPGYGKLSLRTIDRPYKPTVSRMLSDGGFVGAAQQQTKSEDMVLLSIDMGRITQWDLLSAIQDDGKRRNLHWKLAGKEDAVVKLKADETSEYGFGEVREGFQPAPKGWNKPSRYIISFQDRHEVRRFVREWHRRPFPLQREHNPGDEAPPMISAEILW